MLFVIIMVAIVILTIAYLFHVLVGIVGQWLVNKLSGKSYNYNIWKLGLVLWGIDILIALVVRMF